MFYLNLFLEFFALGTGLLLFNTLQPHSYRWFVFLLLVTVTNEAFAYWGVYESVQISKNYFYSGFFFLQSVILWRLFLDAFEKNTYKNLLNLLSIFYILCMLTSLIIGGAQKLNPGFKNFVCLHVISIGLLYYYYLYNSNKIINFQRESFFWLATGIILVNFINIFFVNAIFIKSFVLNPNSKIIYKVLNTFGNVVYYSLITYTLICSSKFRKQVTT